MGRPRHGLEQRQRDLATPRRRQGGVPSVLGRRSRSPSVGPARRLFGTDIRDRRPNGPGDPLDNRYNLDPWDYEGTDPSRRVLGEEQWAWLRERLLEPATVRIIGSGVQVVQDYDIDLEWEGWGDSPHERDRLFDLVRALRIPGVVFVSGDMHFAELTRHPDDAAALGYPTYDLTPSGLDQVERAGIGQWVNPNRVGELLNSNRKHGLVEIDWEPVDPEISPRNLRSRPAPSGPRRPAVRAPARHDQRKRLTRDCPGLVAGLGTVPDQTARDLPQPHDLPGPAAVLGSEACGVATPTPTKRSL